MSTMIIDIKEYDRLYEDKDNLMLENKRLNKLISHKENEISMLKTSGKNIFIIKEDINGIKNEFYSDTDTIFTQLLDENKILNNIIINLKKEISEKNIKLLEIEKLKNENFNLNRNISLYKNRNILERLVNIEPELNYI